MTCTCRISTTSTRQPGELHLRQSRYLRVTSLDAIRFLSEQHDKSSRPPCHITLRPFREARGLRLDWSTPLPCHVCMHANSFNGPCAANTGGRKLQAACLNFSGHIGSRLRGIVLFVVLGTYTVILVTTIIGAMCSTRRIFVSHENAHRLRMSASKRICQPCRMGVSAPKSEPEAPAPIRTSRV